MDLNALIEKLEADLAAARRLRDNYGPNGISNGAASEAKSGKRRIGESDDPVFLAKWHTMLAETLTRSMGLKDALDVLRSKGVEVTYAKAFAYLSRQVSRSSPDYEKKGKKYHYTGEKKDT